MKIENQHNAELAQLTDLIADMSVCMMTNIDSTGALISRPMAPIKMDSDGVLWFFTDLRSSTVEYLGCVNLSFVDSSEGTYVSIAGYCEVTTDREFINDMWTSAAQPWFPDGPESDTLAILKFFPQTAEYWDAPESQMVKMFVKAASVVSGKPAALGEHGSLTNLSQAGADHPQVKY